MIYILFISDYSVFLFHSLTFFIKIVLWSFTECECFGHADKCHYDQNVADKKLSINTLGKYQGGGVCDDCKVIYIFFLSVIYLNYTGQTSTSDVTSLPTKSNQQIRDWRTK